MKTLHLEIGGEIVELAYRLDGQELVLRRGEDGEELRFRVEDLGAELLITTLEGRRRIGALRDGDRVHLAEDAEPFVVKRHLPQDIGSGTEDAAVDLEAPMTGKVVKVLAAPGDRLQAGDTVVIVEAMKMEHKLSAPFDARLETLSVEEGQQVDMNEKLAHLVRLEEETQDSED